MKRFLAAMLALLVAISFFAACGSDDDSDDTSDTGDGDITPFQEGEITLTQIGQYESLAPFDEGGTEISAYCPTSKKLFSTNGDEKVVEIIDFSDPTKPSYSKSIDPSQDWDGAKAANSVATKNGIVALAVQADDDGVKGKLMLYDTEGSYLNALEIGYLPDMVTFSPDGKSIVVACEGEPYYEDGSDEDATDAKIYDPEGSIAIIDISEGASSATATMLTFEDYEAKAANFLRTPMQSQLAGDARLQESGSYRDFEPEYVAVSEDSTTAFVSLQENNGMVVVDLATKKIKEIYGLGYKDLGVDGNGFDGADDGKAQIETAAGIRALYLPDTIASVTIDNQIYVLSANEGDDREFAYDLEVDGEEEEIVFYSDLSKVKKLDKGISSSFTGDADKYEDLRVLTDMGLNSDSEYEYLYTSGARSFSIWNGTDMTQVFDSGDQFEQIMMAAEYVDYFNCSDDDIELDSRSPKSGPEPEALTVGKLDGHTLAFIGLEKFGGTVIYDISDPENAVYLNYITNRDFSIDTDAIGEDDDATKAGDIAPEGMLFLSSELSPNGKDLLVVSNEVSGTITVWEVAAQ